MNRLQVLKSVLIGGASALTLAGPASARIFDIPDGDLAAALAAYMKQSNVALVYVDDAVHGHKSRGARGDYTETAALTRILEGTGFTAVPTQSSAIGIVPAPREAAHRAETIRVAAAAPRAPAPGAVETVVVTAQKKSENIQNVPIAVTALSQQQLTERQIAGGPDLLRDVPNMNFGKTNFSGYSIELRGIGTQAISVTTDPAVAVAFNGTPFIRNHFFEQEFYDLGDVEVLRGPQGTLYGRNATAGVVNLKSAQPTDQFEAMASADIGNFSNRRFEGMINLPIVGDKLDLRLAGEWTMRDGYTQDTTLNASVDGRDLWSSRMSLRWQAASGIDISLIWEHFQEDDDRLRSGKQLCKTAPIPTEILGVPANLDTGGAISGGDSLTQGCELTSLYSSDAFEVPNGFALPYYSPLGSINVPIQTEQDPYSSTTQSRNLRSIESAILPIYRSKNDTLEMNIEYKVNRNLTLISQTGFNSDFLWSTEDYNRFDTAPGAFEYSASPYQSVNITLADPLAGTNGIPSDAGIFCDPQLGCSDRLIAQDLSKERAWQLSQEFRVVSNFDGPLNFSAGVNYLHYETVEDYYVFINSLSLAAASHASPYAATYFPGVTDNSQCLTGAEGFNGYQYVNPLLSNGGVIQCAYIDPNAIGDLNGQGHNYFRSQNPYILNSYSLFGESYYNLTNDLKLTGGLRWTDDQKHFIDIPSELLVNGYGYPVTGIVDQQWNEVTGRFAVDWAPRLDFTDQTLVYGSYAHGYKAGGANPPGAVFLTAGAFGEVRNPIHPLKFKPEHIEAFELGTKNTVLDNSMTINGDVFYYNYHGYQISRIVDRSAINDNFDAHVVGAELESVWEPLPGLRLNLATGWENAAVAKGMYSVDLMDRTAGNPNWLVVRPFPTQASNCILPAYVLLFQANRPFANGNIVNDCGAAYGDNFDPVTRAPYAPNPTVDAAGYVILPGTYRGFDPSTAPNNGQGFSKNLSGNKLPNAPPLTLSFGGQYSMPVSADWAATFRGDFYWQADSWARIFNDHPYDRLHGYTNLNLALILDSADGWQVMGYVKNVFDTTAITGDFLNSDDTGLTTNVFLTDPRLYGVRVTKNFGEGDSGALGDAENYIADLFADKDNGRPPLWIELGGGFDFLQDRRQLFDPPFVEEAAKNGLTSPLVYEKPPAYGLDEAAKVSFTPEGTNWVFSAAVRYGRAKRDTFRHQQTNHFGVLFTVFHESANNARHNYAETRANDKETHTVMDFLVGKDVGLGELGMAGSSAFNGGIRIAQLRSKSAATIYSDPNYVNLKTASNIFAPKYFQNDKGNARNKHSFTGIGPEIAWNASAPLTSDGENSGVSFDWGINGAVLFGRQKARSHHQTTGKFESGIFPYFLPVNTSHYTHSKSAARSRTVTVPNLGASIGLSYRYSNAKISFGYRVDEFFGAMDGGIDAQKSYNFGDSGPYLNVSIGIGG